MLEAIDEESGKKSWKVSANVKKKLLIRTLFTRKIKNNVQTITNTCHIFSSIKT